MGQTEEQSALEFAVVSRRSIISVANVISRTRVISDKYYFQNPHPSFPGNGLLSNTSPGKDTMDRLNPAGGSGAEISTPKVLFKS